MPLLELKKLLKAFGGLKAVNEVSFQVEKGEIFGLIGPNGSGKTTIFNCINNFYPITGGDVLFKGKSIKGLKPHKVCHLGIGRTFQVVKPLARMTVLDNVTASAFCRVNTIREAKKEANRILEFCNLERSKENSQKASPSEEGKGWRSPGPWPRNRK
jgi:branched-chain amino acid transport system ATP-binding protein